jgi:hypothetical protein
MKICKELEQEFNLIPLKKGKREFEYPKRIDYRGGDLKHKAGNTIKAVMANFHFQSFGEYRTMLELFNLTAEEVKGIHNGIQYSVTDSKGNKMGRPFKSALFGNPTEYTVLELAEEVINFTNSKSRIKFLPAVQNDPQQRCPDISLAKKILNWQPKVTFKQTIEYFKATRT